LKKPYCWPSKIFFPWMCQKHCKS